MEELTFEQTNELEVIDMHAEETQGKTKHGGKVLFAVLGGGLVLGLIAKGLKKSKAKRQAKRDAKDIKRLTEAGYLITPPMMDVDVDSNDKESK